MTSLELQLSLWKNIALLSVAVFVYGRFLSSLLRFTDRTRSGIIGLLFGILAILGMFMPVQVAPGVIVDSRVILTGLAGYFAGGPAA